VSRRNLRIAVAQFVLVYALLPSAAVAVLPELRSETAWKQDISAAPLDSESGAMIAWLDADGGWGLGTMRIDFSIDVVETVGGDPALVMQELPGYFTPDCDPGRLIPLPVGGTVEGSTNYECLGGDCHLLVYDALTNELFEVWIASVDLGVLTGQCLAHWDLDDLYPVGNRGPSCVSADASGMPIAPLLIDADEVANDSIDHAIRFNLPNSRIRDGVYLDPASTETFAPSAPSPAPPRGARFRLRADYPLETLPNDGARAVARAMQTYGMVLGDTGSIALTARSDRGTTAKWNGLLGPLDLSDLQVTDFEVVDGGERIAQGDCVRQDPIGSVPILGTWSLIGLGVLLGATGLRTVTRSVADSKFKQRFQYHR
jgi:serine/threonine-protein kinase